MTGGCAPRRDADGLQLMSDGYPIRAGELRRTQSGIPTIEAMFRSAYADSAVIAVDVDGDFVTLTRADGMIVHQRGHASEYLHELSLTSARSPGIPRVGRSG